jgi:membrane-anchored protein YejM (alkaline phosphatase superfamily)
LDLAKALARNPVLRDLRIFSEGSLWRMRESLGLPPESPMDAARRALGEGGLREAYARNLEIVLSHVSDLLEALQGTIVVTSDHGERLGEGGRFSHGHGLRDRLLLEVPWLVTRR